jgi:hypothetical protein
MMSAGASSKPPPRSMPKLSAESPSRRTRYGRSAGVAAIMSGDDHVGMGMVIGPRTVLTCAHVVNEARGYDGTSTPRPSGEVRLVFPLAALQSERLAEVSKWIPVQAGTRSGDVALLQLAEDERDIEPDVGIATFADVTGRTIDEDRLGVYGICGGEMIGQHVQARFVGDAGAAMTQIDSTDEAGLLIRAGFSGAAIFDEREQAIVGMVQRVKTNASALSQGGPSKAQPTTAALALNAAQLAQLVPELEVEPRGRPAWFQAAWPLAALFLLLASVSHFWVSQGGRGWIAKFALESEHLQLAAFYGMHVLALLGAGVAWLLWQYSRDFSLSHWSRRIPPFPLCRESWRPGRRVAMSTTVVALFVVLPLYAQGHFLLKFHGQGQVFAHVSTFGEAAWKGVEPDCVIEGDFCRHPQAGRYAFMTGAKSIASHFDHAYVYGERRKDSTEEALTYFPVVQPLVVLALTALWVVLLVLWGIGVLRTAGPDSGTGTGRPRHTAAGAPS